MWPVTHFFNENKFSDNIDFIEQVPSQLNKKMSLGEIDIGAISSFSYAEHADQYALLPNLSVSCFGIIGSISLFLKTDINKLGDKKIAVTNTSLTSVNLLKIILEEFYNAIPEYISMKPSINDMMQLADAALLIGDEALLANIENKRTNRYTVVDLGEEWRQRTNHWMTFAVYAVRKNALREQPELINEIYKEFLNSKRLGYENIDLIIKAAMDRFNGSYDFWQNYFKGLSHDFDKEQLNGLKFYYKMAKKIGLINEIPKIEVVDFS